MKISIIKLLNVVALIVILAFGNIWYQALFSMLIVFVYIPHEFMMHSIKTAVNAHITKTEPARLKMPYLLRWYELFIYKIYFVTRIKRIIKKAYPLISYPMMIYISLSDEFGKSYQSKGIAGVQYDMLKKLDDIIEDLTTMPDENEVEEGRKRFREIIKNRQDQ